MCLLAVLSRVHPDAPLIVAANRDEWLLRPATAMTVLRESEPRILGGRLERTTRELSQARAKLAEASDVAESNQKG